MRHTQARHRKIRTTGQLGWSRDSFWIANVSAAIACAGVLGMLVAAVMIR